MCPHGVPLKDECKDCHAPERALLEEMASEFERYGQKDGDAIRAALAELDALRARIHAAGGPCLNPDDYDESAGADVMCECCTARCAGLKDVAT
jgi:hypothetical protein